MTETLAHWYSSESTQRELSTEYQHDRVSMVFKEFCVLVLGKISLNIERVKGTNFDLLIVDMFQV